MSKHFAELRWKPGAGEDFLSGRYSRVHELHFDGGAAVSASASPTIVAAPFSDAKNVDPEELFVASLSSCHMLWFLDLAKRAKVSVRFYHDEAEGLMAKNAEGRTAITHVTLRPLVECDADVATIESIHHKAHDACFIANSVRTEVVVEPRF
ncbi:OsmC family protein [Mesorhizobium sp.]|uniref:OsmC family protein n=1 Tax=Mesorhizobium sp. TaxID=1871066 RepID=UPI000FE7E113|nr:OsmC family protein [Mesorhizobium sp.]RWC43381.1 MAG: OsmC family peroxiredoxin [Mesorhizobium sp.]RWF00144.1 MAG: OsmC family peroxiredoxin [Mesorhizobium sp.]TIR35884.1 MAG: OsmC family peroxiredoxin [Mesorhizobium sp.]TIS25067.1 MAG: OsmC family peroxiredoxin [Mesorhizobium sp.]TIS67416.1 MAG: OsmC family peroxiredoxin [Mesorhizobium sp.]